MHGGGTKFVKITQWSRIKMKLGTSLQQETMELLFPHGSYAPGQKAFTQLQNQQGSGEPGTRGGASRNFYQERNPTPASLTWKLQVASVWQATSQCSKWSSFVGPLEKDKEFQGAVIHRATTQANTVTFLIMWSKHVFIFPSLCFTNEETETLGDLPPPTGHSAN